MQNKQSIVRLYYIYINKTIFVCYGVGDIILSSFKHTGFPDRNCPNVATKIIFNR